eukprot:6102806-Prorocentrum_lima.AAC.1
MSPAEFSHLHCSSEQKAWRRGQWTGRRNKMPGQPHGPPALSSALAAPIIIAKPPASCGRQ